MMGYEPGTKAYRLWDPKQRRMFISRDVIFDERLKPPSIPEQKVDLTEIIWNGENAVNELGVTRVGDAWDKNTPEKGATTHIEDSYGEDLIN